MLFVFEQKAREFYERTGLGDMPQVLVNGVPLKQADLNADDFEESIVRQIMLQTPAIQKAVYHVSTASQSCDVKNIISHMQLIIDLM